MDIIEPIQLIKFIAALLFVIGLMTALTLVLRRLRDGQALPGGPRRRRLALVETLPLDTRRRLVILRRDNREHLVILGANGETVIETNIESPQDDGA